MMEIVHKLEPTQALLVNYIDSINTVREGEVFALEKGQSLRGSLEMNL